MEMPAGFRNLINQYTETFRPEDGDFYPEELKALNLMEEMAKDLEGAENIISDELRFCEFPSLKKFKEWK